MDVTNDKTSPKTMNVQPKDVRGEECSSKRDEITAEHQKGGSHVDKTNDKADICRREAAAVVETSHCRLSIDVNIDQIL